MDKSVYIIGPDGGPYKVGHTIDIARRVAHLQCGSPVRLLIHFHRQAPSHIPAKDVERRTQQGLSAFHVWGEWFNCPLPLILSEIEAAFLYAGTIQTKPLPRALSPEQQRLRDDRKASGLTRAQWKHRTQKEKLQAMRVVSSEAAGGG